MKVVVALLALASVALAVPGPGTTLPGDTGAPSGYSYVGTGTHMSRDNPTRLMAGFEATSLIDSETKDITEAACAALCDDIDICRAYFFWNDGVDENNIGQNRCRLLRHSRQLMVTQTMSVSAVKNIIANYHIAAVGNVDSNTGDMLRFANAFNLEDRIFRNSLPGGLSEVLVQCFTPCDTDVTCQGVFLYYEPVDSPGYKCIGLRRIQHVYISTNVESWSLGKISFAESDLFLEDGYTLVEQGRNAFNGGLSFRLKSAFGDVQGGDPNYALLGEVPGTSAKSCSASCKSRINCEGALHYKKGSNWSCRMLTTVEDSKVVRTETVSYSITRDSDRTVETTNTPVTGTNGKYTDAVLAPNGKIYAAPRHTPSGLVFDPVADSASSLTGQFDTIANSYVGSVLIGTKVYAIPYSAGFISVIETNTDTVTMSLFSTTVLAAYPGNTVNKWTAGANVNGVIYCSPFSATHVLAIDTANNDNNWLINLPAGIVASNTKFVGAVAFGSKVVFIPFSALVVAFLDTANSNTWTLTPVTGAGTNRWNGAFLAANNMIYAAPLQSDYVLKIDPATEQVFDTIQVPVTTSTTLAKWKAPAATLDNKVFHLFPNAAASVLSIDTELDVATEHFDSDGAFGASNQKYSGSVAVPGLGRIYGTPYKNDNIPRIQL